MDLFGVKTGGTIDGPLKGGSLRRTSPNCVADRPISLEAVVRT